MSRGGDRLRRRTIAAAALAVSCCVAAGCGETTLDLLAGDAAPPAGAPLGAACAQDTQCASARCLLGGDYPEGTCSAPCSAAAPCPAGSGCVAAEGAGVCLPLCAPTTACRTGYECQDARGIDGLTELFVCLGDETDG